MIEQITSEGSTEKVGIDQKERENCVEDEHESTYQQGYGHGNGSFLTAYFNIVCVVAGTGTLGLPKAFADGGWLGILILILAHSMAVYSGIVLIRCLYYKPGQRLHGYKAIGKAAFGTIGYIITSCLHILNLFGCPTLYLVLASQNMRDLLIGTKGELNMKIWSIIWGAFLLIPSLILKTMRELTAISALGAICTMMAVFVVVIQGPMYRNSHPEIEVHHDSVIWTGFPVALSTIAFSYGGNNTYPHVEHALKKPHLWKYAVTAGLSTCSALYFLTAIPGYWSFGSSTLSPVYNSLPPGVGRTLSMIVMTIHVIFAIPIYTTSFSLEFEQWTNCNEERYGVFGAWLGRAMIRTVTMAILVVLACFIPYFSDFMGLIGALANCGLVFLLPVLCYLKLTGVRNKPWYELAFCVLTLFLGIVGCVFGTIDSVKALIRNFQS
ncbi:transmembrane amino acid transporter protein-domain-containing protein [Pilobolus umbonatus]|nr:transmembrane amino acid transporter protein-domain-containing protein [Pilobolus umbonatus]